MKKILLISLLSLIVYASTAFASATPAAAGAGAMDISSSLDAESSRRTAASYFSIGNPEAFKVAVLEGGLVATPVHAHSYDLSEKDFNRTDRVVSAGAGESDDWVTIALAYRYGVPKLGVHQARDEALRILLKPAQKERNISALFHIAAMVADNEVTAYLDQVREVLAIAESLALGGNAPLLTVLLEIDKQANKPILGRFEYKRALRRIIATTPNARAYIALAQCADGERFPLTVLGHYQDAIRLEPDNVDAFFSAGVVVDNGPRNNIRFLKGTPSSLYYFGEAYSRGKIFSGNYYGSALYERAAITADVDSARKDFTKALAILEESTIHDQDALLSLADFHATEHEAKRASFEASFEYIKRYMKYDLVNKLKAIEVIENLKASMVRLGAADIKLFRRIAEFQDRWSLKPVDAGSSGGTGDSSGTPSSRDIAEQ